MWLLAAVSGTNYALVHLSLAELSPCVIMIPLEKQLTHIFPLHEIPTVIRKLSNDPCIQIQVGHQTGTITSFQFPGP